MTVFTFQPDSESLEVPARQLVDHLIDEACPDTQGLGSLNDQLRVAVSMLTSEVEEDTRARQSEVILAAIRGDLFAPRDGEPLIWRGRSAVEKRLTDRAAARAVEQTSA